MKINSLLKVIAFNVLILSFLQNYFRARIGLEIPHFNLLFDISSFCLVSFYLINEENYSIPKISLFLGLFTICYVIGMVSVNGGLINISGSFLPTLLSLFSSWLSAFFLWRVGLAFSFIKAIYFFVLIDVSLFLLLGGDIKESFFIGASYNYTSALVLFLSVTFVSLQYSKTSKVILLPSFLFFILSIYLVDARAGLILGVLFFLLSLAFRFSTYGYLFKGVGILVIIFILVFFYQDLYQYYLMTRFSDKGVESERFDMWSAYFSNVNLTSFIFGVDMRNIPIIRDFNLNPHNSFIRLHSNLGVFAIILFFFFLFSFFRLYIKNERFQALLIMLLLIRSLTDSLVFPNMLSIFLFLVLFASFRNLNSDNNRNTHVIR